MRKPYIIDHTHPSARLLFRRAVAVLAQAVRYFAYSALDRPPVHSWLMDLFIAPVTGDNLCHRRHVTLYCWGDEPLLKLTSGRICRVWLTDGKLDRIGGDGLLRPE